jgi:DNA-binding GntR family transcriptional regulator
MQLIGERKSLNQEVYQYIRQEIVNGRWQTGEKILEQTLAQQLKVSRTPIREAFNQLAREDIVELIPQRGCFVRLIVK